MSNVDESVIKELRFGSDYPSPDWAHLPGDQRVRRRTGDPLLVFLREASDWPQPMQDDLIPLLQANGFRTAEEQAANMKRALLRAAALDSLMSGRERRQYARRYGRPNAIRLVWWVRRQLKWETWDG